MDPLPSEPQFNTPPPKNWFSRHHFLGYGFLVLVLVVAVGLIYWWQYGQTPSQSDNSYVPPISDQTDETADWKTYTNTQYGFELKYPGNISVVQVGVYHESTQNLSIGIDILPMGTTMGDAGLSWQNTSVGGKTAYFVDRTSSSGGAYRIMVIALSTNFQTSGDTLELKITLPKGSVYDQILSTFRFVESSRSETIEDIDSTWRLYTNFDLGVSFRVPKFLSPRIQPSTIQSSTRVCLYEEDKCIFSVIVGKNITNDSALLDFFSNAISTDNYEAVCREIEEKRPAAQNGVYDVKIKGDPLDGTAGNCWLNFVYDLKFYPEKDKASYWGVGQDVNVFKEGKAYDFDIINSFRFVN